jgi:hypothetical protein
LGKVVLGPVPVARGGIAYIFPDKPISACTLEVYDLVAEIAATATFNGSSQPVWNVGNLSPGVYIAIIKVTYLDGSTGTTHQKMVVSR